MSTPAAPAPKPPENTLPLMALRDLVIVPQVKFQLYVGRSKSLRALAAATEQDSQIIFVTQREENDNDPGPQDLFDIGCLAKIVEIYDADNGSKQVTVEGVARVAVSNIKFDEHKVQRCEYRRLVTEIDAAAQAKLLPALHKHFKGQKKRAAAAVLKELKKNAANIGEQLDLLMDSCRLPVSIMQQFLSEAAVPKRLELLLDYFARQKEIALVEEQFNRQANTVNKEHREDYLKKKAARIQNDLGDSGLEDVDELRHKVEQAGMNADATAKCLAEINRLHLMTPLSPEASVIRSYLDVILGLPWQQRTEINYDLVAARKVLDADHKGLDKVKDRIIENLAVQQQVGHNRGSVMCFLGPPGVGKTSLGRSIAKATGRKFVRLALGGIHDEATIRGHRRTYVASMPGRILRSMAEAKVTNPVFMLDEIDKLAASLNGDPMAALLEVIDPEQNKQFIDQYAEVEFDLSEVMFIATANTSDEMYAALHDRLEVIELPGYTDQEKLAIAKQHLVPKTLAKTGLAARELRFSDAVLKSIIRDYTKEAGVRNLERNIAKVCRKAVLELDITSRKRKTKAAATKKAKFALPKDKLPALLGPPLIFSALKRRDAIGIVNGLAIVNEWEGIVNQIDAICLPGKDGLVKTGNLMPHIEQSIDAACAVLRAKPGRYGLNKDFLDNHQVHIHYPNIDIAVDGNSNGLALFALLVSVLNDIPVRVDTAITGAINLRGEACAIGGLRQKLIGAWRERIHRVIIPQVQVREVAEVPQEILRELEIIAVKDVAEVIKHLLVRLPEKPTRGKDKPAPAVIKKGTKATRPRAS